MDFRFTPMDERTRRRRRRLALLRRCSVLLGSGLIVAAVILVSQISVQDTRGHELLNGQSSSQSLLLPLGLFALGGVALAFGLQ